MLVVAVITLGPLASPALEVMLSGGSGSPVAVRLPASLHTVSLSASSHGVLSWLLATPLLQSRSLQCPSYWSLRATLTLLLLGVLSRMDHLSTA